jgi:hypothetical protein
MERLIMSVTMNKKQPQSGYTHCACRDCMETTVSSDTSKPELCTECKGAGCMPLPKYASNDSPRAGGQWDCQRDDAYEG